MRIIAGKYRRRLIQTIEGLNTRPVTDRIKESIFNVLIHRYSIEDAKVLDLFAGSGSFGLESLSRGASRITFIEKSPDSYKVLLENISVLKCESDCVVHNMAVERFLNNCSEKFDLIFCDPPFKNENSMEILAMIFEKKILKESGLIIFRNDSEEKYKNSQFRLLHKKIFGRNVVYFLTY